MGYSLSKIVGFMVAYLSQPGLGLSKLNFHKCRRNFRDAINSFKEYKYNLLSDVNVALENNGHSV